MEEEFALLARYYMSLIEGDTGFIEDACKLITDNGFDEYGHKIEEDNG